VSLSDLLIVVVAVGAGAISAVTGFGIGSLLTPILASSVDMHLAVALVSIPHVVGTALRFFMRSGAVDWRVFWSFGLTSAAGGLMGAWIYARATNRWLAMLLGGLLLFAAIAELSGLSRRMRFRGWVAWVAGALSGLLGGLVGNQGGIRSAALLGFGLGKEAFVATATAVALVVDGARLPVYLSTQGQEMLRMWPSVALATAGVVAGTVVGSHTLSRIPETTFRVVLALVLAILGLWLLAKPLLN
jgi:uncharacterized protein